MATRPPPLRHRRGQLLDAHSVASAPASAARRTAALAAPPGRAQIGSTIQHPPSAAHGNAESSKATSISTRSVCARGARKANVRLSPIFRSTSSRPRATPHAHGMSGAPSIERVKLLFWLAWRLHAGASTPRFAAMTKLARALSLNEPRHSRFSATASGVHWVTQTRPSLGPARGRARHSSRHARQAALELDFRPTVFYPLAAQAGNQNRGARRAALRPQLRIAHAVT